MVRFTQEDIGCWADGALGWAHVRRVLADLVRDTNPGLAEELEGPPSADMSEELEALALLQEVTEEGLVWTLDSEGLFLLREEEEVAQW